MRLVHFSLVACVALAAAAPLARESASQPSEAVKARAPMLSNANEKRQSWFEWLETILGSDDGYDDYDEEYGDFDTGVLEAIGKRRSLPLPRPKDKRQLDWFYDEDSYYDDWTGDFQGRVSANDAKVKGKRQEPTM